MQSAARRPAHRPSRRGVIVQAAMDLLVEYPPDTLTVATIAEAAGMTSAAVYYHYPSKDAIIISGISEVGQSYLAAVRRAVTDVREGRSIGDIPVDIMRWAEGVVGAHAYFIAAAGLSPAVEAERRQVQIEVIEHLVRAVRRYRPDLKAAEVSVRAVALLSIIETALGSQLTMDKATRGLTPSRFRVEVSAIAEQVVSG